MVGGSKASSAATVQRGLMLRRLQHSQLQNALIRQKTQRFFALKALCRSVELRRQLSHAQTAASCAAGVARPIPAPPLDPSVKALIEKLTEIAKIVPEYSEDRPGLPRQRALLRRGEPNSEQQRAAIGYPSRAHTSDRKAFLAATMGGLTSESETMGNLSDSTHKAEDNDSSVGGEGIEAAVGDSHVPNTLFNEEEEYMDPAEEDEILGEQLRNLDSSMNTMFQDLEKKVKTDGNRDLESSKEEKEAEKVREEEHRQKEKAALMAQLEGLSGGGLHRRPKWRWIAEGIDDPHPDRVLKGKYLWKAATLLIIVFYVRPKMTLMQRKARWDKHELVGK